ncbi:methionine ABC transporter permease [Anaerofustis stercorihominis]|uniref:ABC transporter, permease protein n=1 Tax=Anaerofustis stercorihominis DSM 17244 TaxID=445971 RepID=B1CBJ2_9FIRM|nr:methionine ABC transporter permease [Anaerofustis stercorihominis]EDS71639.1 ABC transporter, permease protein [Anaerofustis stercorihominis DSM 17244]
MLTGAEWQMVGVGILQTLYMTIVSTVIAYIIGLPMGILLVTSAKDGIKENKILFKILDILTNVLRSVPFLILLVLVIPLTRLIVGTTIGSTATIVPLVIGAAPFIARMVESSLKEVDRGVIEASLSMGASPYQIVSKVMITESMPSLMVGFAISITTILGYSALAGFVGGGGLGDIAIRYGYYRYQSNIMIVTVILLVLIVQILQAIGTKIATKIDKRI